MIITNNGSFSRGEIVLQVVPVISLRVKICQTLNTVEAKQRAQKYYLKEQQILPMLCIKMGVMQNYIRTY